MSVCCLCLLYAVFFFLFLSLSSRQVCLESHSTILL